MDTTIIIPTTCETARAALLERAIGSLRSQRPEAPLVLIVANGPRVDAGLAARIGALPNVTVEYRAEASLPGAIRHGVSRVATPCYGFLDDDDEYLEDAIAIRRDALQDTAIDVVVTNGYECRDGRDALWVEDPPAVVRDPLRALLTENWLASCGGLYRRARVPEAYYDGVTRYYEWTLLAYKLAASRRVTFIDTPTFRVHDSPASLSKTAAYREAQIGVLQKIATLELPQDIHRSLRARMGRAHHDLASFYLRSGVRDRALRHHLASLAGPGGLRYLPWSRKLLPFWPSHSA